MNREIAALPLPDLTVKNSSAMITKTGLRKEGYLGVRYRKNGEDSSGFDCSGFTLRIFYETWGILMPHSSQAQYEFGKHVDRENLRFGDLVFLLCAAVFLPTSAFTSGMVYSHIQVLSAV